MDGQRAFEVLPMNGTVGHFGLSTSMDMHADVRNIVMHMTDIQCAFEGKRKWVEILGKLALSFLPLVHANDEAHLFELFFN